MDILRRELAPITDRAWDEITEQAQRVLRSHLSGRTLVDVDGPHGLEYSAVGLGRLDVRDEEPVAGVSYGVRRVQPLIETRAQLELDVWELDNADRGAADIELDEVDRAAAAIATFEEHAVYRGFEPAGIVGIAGASTHEPIAIGDDGFPGAVARGVVALRTADVEGPYRLILGPDMFRRLESDGSTYPARRQIERMLDSSPVLAPVVEGGYLVTTRGGDFELVLGQDLSIGYETHDARTVRLYLTESFTFRVLEPAAAVCLE